MWVITEFDASDVSNRNCFGIMLSSEQTYSHCPMALAWLSRFGCALLRHIGDAPTAPSFECLWTNVFHSGVLSLLVAAFQIAGNLMVMIFSKATSGSGCEYHVSWSFQMHNASWSQWIAIRFQVLYCHVVCCAVEGFASAECCLLNTDLQCCSFSYQNFEILQVKRNQAITKRLIACLGLILVFLNLGQMAFIKCSQQFSILPNDGRHEVASLYLVSHTAVSCWLFND